jgi:hypothetical protein
MKKLITLLSLVIISFSPITSHADSRDVIEKIASNTTTEICDVIRGEDLLITVCENEISWCMNEFCGTDPYETTFGCQYFGEYGADDLATCILTMLDIMCCGCISGYDQCEV